MTGGGFSQAGRGSRDQDRLFPTCLHPAPINPRRNCPARSRCGDVKQPRRKRESRDPITGEPFTAGFDAGPHPGFIGAMHADPALADRVAAYFARKNIPFESKRMMGGLLFMVRGKMCVGARPQRLMARVGPDAEAAALKRAGCRPMDFTGRPLRGFVFIDAANLGTARQLGYWLDLALAFNPAAKSSARTRTARPG